MAEKKTFYKIFLFTLLMGYCLIILLIGGTNYQYVWPVLLVLLIIFFGGLFYFLRKEIKISQKELTRNETNY